MEQIEKVPAKLRFSLNIFCPKCGEEIDLTDSDHEGMYVNPIFNNKWEDLKDETVVCVDCDTEFQISEVEY